MNIVLQRPLHRASGDQTQIFHYKKKRLTDTHETVVQCWLPVRRSNVKVLNERKKTGPHEYRMWKTQSDVNSRPAERRKHNSNGLVVDVSKLPRFIETFDRKTGDPHLAFNGKTLFRATTLLYNRSCTRSPIKIIFVTSVARRSGEHLTCPPNDSRYRSDGCISCYRPICCRHDGQYRCSRRRRTIFSQMQIRQCHSQVKTRIREDVKRRINKDILYVSSTEAEAIS